VLIVLGIAAMLVVVIGVVVVMALARKQVEHDDVAPPSRGADFVAPVSSGGYRFRAPDESPEDFKARVDRENDEIASSRR
jgi:hypothetical protein